MTQRFVILTSNQRRHSFFVNTISRRLPVAGVVVEEKAAQSPYERTSIVAEHLAARSRAELAYFGSERMDVTDNDVLRVRRGGVNTEDTRRWIRHRQPDALLLYGTSILRAPLLAEYPDRVINLHLGLSPYYRGSGTNFWPLVNDEPECVGFTIHLAIAEVDAGPILRQGRPDATRDDGPNDLGCKTIAEGALAMSAVAPNYLRGTVTSVAQPSGGRVYRRADFSAHAVGAMKANFASGMMERYLLDREARCGQFPIISPAAQ